MYDKILVPLDGSKTDNAIVEHLLKLAKFHNSKLYLLRVLHFHTRDELSYETEEAKEYLKEKAAYFKEAGIHTVSLIEYGEADELIVKEARELKVDLIAMATHGHGWMVDILFGSVAHKVRHSVSIPVLMIRAK